MPQCKRCREDFTVEQQQRQRGRGVYCSLGCSVGQANQPQRGRPRTFDHRYITRNGYVAVKVGRERSSSGYLLEHRLVMEQFLGRPLATHEQVHHRDGNRQNNALSNLEVLNNGEHQRLHHLHHEAERLEATLAEYRQHFGELPRDRAPMPPHPVCPQCGKVFVQLQPRHPRKYCSKACADAARRLDNPEKPCERCGTLFRKRWASETAKARFCSEACACRSMTEARLADYTPPEEKPCVHCGRLFQPRWHAAASAARYCSRACWREDKRGGAVA